MATKKLTVEQVLLNMGQKFASLGNLYVVAPFKSLRNTRKDENSPVSTNPWTEASQANWKNANGTEHVGKKSKDGAPYTRMLCGLMPAENGVTAEARLQVLADIAFTRILPPGVAMSAAYALSAVPTDLLATLIKERFGEQSPHVLAYIRASIRLVTKCTRLTASPKASVKAGPIAL